MKPADRTEVLRGRNQNKHCKGLLKGKQMFVDKVIEKKVLVAGKGERERISGIPTVRRRV